MRVAAAFLADGRRSIRSGSRCSGFAALFATLAGCRLAGVLALARSTGLHTAAIVLVDGRPGTALRLLFRDAAILIAFGDVIGLAFLLVGVFGFVTTGMAMLLLR